MKKKKKQKTEQKTETTQLLISKVTQKLDMKQNLKSFLLLMAFTSTAIAGRVALQHVPSVETVTPFSILAGFMLGPIYGLITGASSFYASNFVVWGGQGPWTLFQMLGAGAAGFIAGIFGKVWRGIHGSKKGEETQGGFKLYMTAVIIGILVYEMIVNVGGSLLFLGPILGLGNYLSTALPLYMLTSLPFTLLHLVSSIGICAVLWKCREKLPKLGSKILEKTKIGFRGVGLDLSMVEKEQYKIDGEESKLISKFSWKKNSTS